METFLEYVDKKQRESKRHRRIVAKLLESGGLKVRKNLDDESPYIFVAVPRKKMSFEGVRVYKIGNHMAFRVQKEEKTQPYGKAYPLNLEDMFRDYISDHMDEEKAGKLVVKSVVQEMQKFFKQTMEAEKEIMQGDFSQSDPLGRVIIKSTGTDYSQMVHNKM